tara:strand:- start:335 stop:1783 length:1449 start_codon:yes stop_codon:yes gene_type:complete
MAQTTRDNLKDNFQAGDIPKEGDYKNLIDSSLSIKDNNSGSISLSGSITLSSNISASGYLSAQHITASKGILLGYGGYIHGVDSNAHGNNTFNPIINNLADYGIIFGNNTTGTSILGKTQLIDASGSVQIDSGTGDIQFQSNNSTSITFNTTAGHITASGNISSSGQGINYLGGDTIIVGKLKVSGSDITMMSGSISASGNISASGDIYSNKYFIGDGEGNTAINRNSNGILFGNIYEPTILRGEIIQANQSGGLWVSAGSITSSQNIIATGSIIGSTISSSGAIIGSTLAIDSITSTAAELNLLDGVSGLVKADFTKLAAINTSAVELNYLDGLTSGEATQIKAINTKTISNTQWGYVGNMNQNVTNESSVQFAAITLLKSNVFTGTYGESIATEGQSFRLRLSECPGIPGRASNLIAKSTPSSIKNPSVSVSSVVLATVASAELSVNAFKVTAGFFEISLGNESNADFGGGEVIINFTIF